MTIDDSGTVCQRLQSAPAMAPRLAFSTVIGRQFTTPEAVERAALELFAAQGFEATTVDEVSAAAGISRRTFYRYFTSKIDIPWSNFSSLLGVLDAWLAEVPSSVPMFDAIAEATIRFNRLPTDGLVAHRERMVLIMHTPALRASATDRWGEWRGVVAKFAAGRLDAETEALEPQLIGHLALGASLAAYEHWLRHDNSDLEGIIRLAFHMLAERPTPPIPKMRRRTTG
jgi:TetR/AcrR family transcriptional regulator, regulator of mycofactocin system